jgi:hypothetical protein
MEFSEKDVSGSLNARYAETVAFMFRQLPMYQMVGASAYKKDLHNTLPCSTPWATPTAN